MYHYMDHKEAVEMLRKAGFNHMEIDRITKFRKRFTHGEKDQPLSDHRRLDLFAGSFAQEN